MPSPEFSVAAFERNGGALAGTAISNSGQLKAVKALAGFLDRGLAQDELHVDHVTIAKGLPVLDDVFVRDRVGSAAPAIGIIPERIAIGGQVRDPDVRPSIAGISNPAKVIALGLIVFLRLDGRRIKSGSCSPQALRSRWLRLVSQNLGLHFQVSCFGWFSFSNPGSHQDRHGHSHQYVAQRSAGSGDISTGMRTSARSAPTSGTSSSLLL